MQIIEMYEPDEDLKKKGNQSEKIIFFIKEKARLYSTLNILEF